MSTKRHTLYNLGGAIAPVIIMLVTVPLYLDAVGPARYGVLAIIWLFVGYFGFFDFGLSRATAYAISRVSPDDPGGHARTFWTALLVNLGFGLTGALAIFLIAPLLFAHVFNIPAELDRELLPVLPWLALSVPLLTIEGVLTGALTGRQRFLTLNLRTIVGSVITQGLPLVMVLVLEPSLAIAVPATILARALSVSIYAVIAFRSVGAGIIPKPGDRAMVRSLLGYGSWIGGAQVLNPIITNLDRFLIATFMNPVAVSHYAVPFQLVTRGGFFSRSLANAIFPRLAKADLDQARRLTWKGVRANSALMGVLCASGLLLMEPFLIIWVGRDFAGAASDVGEQLTITVWLTSIGVILQNYLEARGQPKETLRILVLQLIPFALLAFAGLHWFGLIGVAMARNARSLINLVLMARASAFLRETLRLIAIPLALFLALAWGPDMVQMTPVQHIALAAGLWLAMALTAYRAFPEGREMALPMARRAWSALTKAIGAKK